MGMRWVQKGGGRRPWAEHEAEAARGGDVNTGRESWQGQQGALAWRYPMLVFRYCCAGVSS